MNYWFTADTHLGHRRILEYCKRPFSCVEEMDEVIVENINSLVKPNDMLIHLGSIVTGKQIGRAHV